MMEKSKNLLEMTLRKFTSYRGQGESGVQQFPGKNWTEKKEKSGKCRQVAISRKNVENEKWNFFFKEIDCAKMQTYQTVCTAIELLSIAFFFRSKTGYFARKEYNVPVLRSVNCVTTAQFRESCFMYAVNESGFSSYEDDIIRLQQTVTCWPPTLVKFLFSRTFEVHATFC